MRTLVLDDLCKIAKILTEEGYNRDDLKIVITVADEAQLKRVNEDFFYKLNTEAADRGERPDENVESVDVTVSGIKFCYEAVVNGEEKE